MKTQILFLLPSTLLSLIRKLSYKYNEETYTRILNGINIKFTSLVESDPSPFYSSSLCNKLYAKWMFLLAYIGTL